MAELSWASVYQMFMTCQHAVMHARRDTGSIPCEELHHSTGKQLAELTTHVNVLRQCFGACTATLTSSALTCTRLEQQIAGDMPK